MWDFFNVGKIGNLYYMNTDQLQYMHAKYLIFFFKDAITSETQGG